MLAFVTDNASAMVKDKRIIQEKYRHIAIYGCCAHCLNLLISDIMGLKTFDDIKIDANAVVKGINCSQMLKASLLNIQKQMKMNIISLKLPGKTRWGSIVFCV